MTSLAWIYVGQWSATQAALALVALRRRSAWRTRRAIARSIVAVATDAVGFALAVWVLAT